MGTEERVNDDEHRDDHEDFSPGPRTKQAQGITIALLLVGLVTAIFVLQNTRSVNMKFLAWEASVPLAGALLLAVVLGGLLAFLVAFVRQRQYKRALRKEHSIRTRRRRDEHDDSP
jgi:uncharacterized integral membrane protein